MLMLMKEPHVLKQPKRCKSQQTAGMRYSSCCVANDKGGLMASDRDTTAKKGMLSASKGTTLKQ